jgi:hypothetical protein
MIGPSLSAARRLWCPCCSWLLAGAAPAPRDFSICMNTVRLPRSALRHWFRRIWYIKLKNRCC